MRKNSKYVNVLLVMLCVGLTLILGGMVVWNHRQEQKETQRLEKLAAQTDSKKEEKKAEKEEEAPTEPEETPAPAETPAPSAEPEAPQQEASAQGIVCWGDDLLSGDESVQYSYMNVLQRVLQENGSTLPVLDKTLQGGGTLSMMKRAGVPDERIQSFVTIHEQGANGAELYVTERGIRDFTPEELVRDDLNYIPVIFMGYYGGWNHDPNELILQQEEILKTFPDQERFLIVGTRPIDGSVDDATLDAALSQKWGDHYISMSQLTTYPASYYEAQEALAQAIYQKLVDLKYI